MASMINDARKQRFAQRVAEMKKWQDDRHIKTEHRSQRASLTQSRGAPKRREAASEFAAIGDP
jgi:hypothetical protein